MALGDREQIVWRGFSGIDIRRTAIFPELFQAQEQVVQGQLLDARNCRFTRDGRVYWHRNQLKIKSPAKVAGANVAATIAAAGVPGVSRATNVVTVTTTAAHGFVAGNQVTIAGVTDASFNGTFIVASVPTTTSFTYAQTAGNATSGGGTATPTWPIALMEFVNDDYNQLLCLSDDGVLNYMNVVWSETPVQWAYGYELFSAGTWTEGATGLPTNAYFGFANTRGKLFVSSGRSTGFTYGLETKWWDGAALTSVGLATPTAAPTAASHTDTEDELREGTYSYQVVYGNVDFESMPGPVVDVQVLEATASATITPKSAATPNDGDTITINGISYTFEATPASDVGPYVVFISPGGNTSTYAHLARLINGAYEYAPGVSHIRVTESTPEHPDVTAVYAEVAGVPTITLTAKAIGADGNAVTLAESTSDARVHISGATLAGGVTYRHVDLSTIPTGPSGTTYRKLYRAFTESLEPGARGADFQYLTTLNDNTTATYKDNAPQEDLGETIPFDHAIPPRGDFLTFHKDRLWMSGCCYAGESYKATATIAADPTGATWVGNVATITTSAAHGLNVGDVVVIAGVADSSYNGIHVVATVPSTTTFTYALAAVSDASSGGGTVTSGLQVTDLANVLFYSEPDDPCYWPIVNQISVGSSAPIQALVSWNDQLIILKTDSAWVLTGYGESDFTLYQIAGITGVLGPHVASSPYGVLWAGHDAWVMWDGQAVRLVSEYREDTAFGTEPVDIRPPRIPDTSFAAKFPACCYHANQFHIFNGDYTYSWSPEEDRWSVARRKTVRCGFRAFEGNIYQSHILTYMRWGAFDTGLFYITVLDSQFRRDNEPAGNYYDTAGSSTEEFHGEVRIELPPLVAPPGEKVRPLEIWVYGDWSSPVGVPLDDLRLMIYDVDNDEWDNVGLLTANGRLGIPGGYARSRLRLRLQGAHVPYLAIHSVALVYQRYAARG